MFKFKRYESEPGFWFAELAGAIGKGLMAGAAGTLAITLSQMIEMKITKRKPSTAPADAAQKVLEVKPETEEDKQQFSQQIHWAYGTSWGVPRGILSLLGVKGFPATAIHFATIYSTALIMPTQLKVASSLKEWSLKEFAVDALHHAVYAIAAGLVFDAMSDVELF
jgi:hypothetical protein